MTVVPSGGAEDSLLLIPFSSKLRQISSYRLQTDKQPSFPLHLHKVKIALPSNRDSLYRKNKGRSKVVGQFKDNRKSQGEMDKGTNNSEILREESGNNILSLA